MGIYDREYYRSSGPALFERGQVVKWLIIVNIGVFILQLILKDGFTRSFVVDRSVLNGQVWRLLSYAFLHAPETLWHIVFNMLFLFWFGPDMEEWYGSREFLLFYLTAAFLGGIGYVAWELVTGSYHAALGASGAVTAVMVLCALHYPHRKILLFFVFPMSIWVFVIFQVARDLFELLGAGPASGTAVACHLAGAAFGYLYYKRHWHLSGFLSSFKTLIRRAQRPKLRIYREDERVVPLRVGAAETIDEQLEAKLDAVLEKIANSGQESLTENERAILLRASELMRKKRT